MQACSNNGICSYNELHYCQFCHQYESLIKCDIDFYYKLLNAIILLTTTTEISWYACMHVCVRLLRYTDVTAPFFCEESFISAAVA